MWTHLCTCARLPDRAGSERHFSYVSCLVSVTTTHPMHFWTSAGEGREREPPGKAEATASLIRPRQPVLYAVSNGATQASRRGSWSPVTAGSTPCGAAVGGGGSAGEAAQGSGM